MKRINEIISNMAMALFVCIVVFGGTIRIEFSHEVEYKYVAGLMMLVFMILTIVRNEKDECD